MFIEKLLVHTKGHTARSPFILSPWQRDEIVRPLFGTIRFDPQLNDWVRQYRTAWIEIARKNGKSELASAIALLGLVGDDEESAEVYSVAADRDQAALVFNTAKRMVELSPVLSKRLEVIDSRKRIIDRKTNSVYAVLPGDAAGALGVNASMVIMDEVLTQKDRHLYDAMRQSFGTRRQPLIVCITTAAYTSAQFCLEEHEYSMRVEEKPLLDPARFVWVRNLPQGWDWSQEGSPADPEREFPATGWYFSNPGLGDFLNIETLRDEFRAAREKPSEEQAFRVYRLNQWVAARSRWLSMDTWRSAAGSFTRSDLSGRRCLAGLDLASTSDFTAWVLAFPGSPSDPDAAGFTLLPRFWVPRNYVTARKDSRERFEAWERQGFLTITPGATVDYDRVFADICRDAEEFDLRLCGYDPWNAASLVQKLEDHGMTCVKIPQSASRLNEPCKLLESAVADKVFRHGGNPVLEWMASNVELDIKGDGLVKPRRNRGPEKIDGIAAALNALAVTLVPEEAEEPEVTFISFDEPPTEAADVEKLLANWNDEEDEEVFFA